MLWRQNCSSRNNIISNNSLFNTGLYIRNVGLSVKNIIVNNTVNGKPLIHIYKKSNLAIDCEAGQIIIQECNNITIQNQRIYNTTIGIHILKSSNCYISDNTITDCKYVGLYLGDCDGSTISSNIIKNNNYTGGIYLFSGYQNNFINNNITNNNDNGITLLSCPDNTISGNEILNNKDTGIELLGSYNINIIDNNISNNDDGIKIRYSDRNNIGSNSVSKNKIGVYIISSTNNTIFKNNFLNNIFASFFEYSKDNFWNHNYWNKPRLFPKIIFGIIEKNSRKFLWYNIDWHPAKEPYDV